MEDKYFAALVIVIMFAFFGLLFALGYGEHVKEMECMKQHGESIRGTCVFRAAR